MISLSLHKFEVMDVNSIYMYEAPGILLADYLKDYSNQWHLL